MIVIVIVTLLGILWPLEGMPKFLRYISYCLPSTYAAEAMRSIMGRGSVGHVFCHVTSSSCYRIRFRSFGCMERICNNDWLVCALCNISNYWSQTKKMNRKF